LQKTGLLTKIEKQNIEVKLVKIQTLLSVCFHSQNSLHTIDRRPPQKHVKDPFLTHFLTHWDLGSEQGRTINTVI
jgi:hypothetical protein